MLHLLAWHSKGCCVSYTVIRPVEPLCTDCDAAFLGRDYKQKVRFSCRHKDTWTRHTNSTQTLKIQDFRYILLISPQLNNCTVWCSICTHRHTHTHTHNKASCEKQYILMLNLEVQVSSKPVIEPRLLNITRRIKLNEKRNREIITMTTHDAHTPVTEA